MQANPEIEHFKIWSRVYLMWVNSNFDRIASEAIKRHSVKPQLKFVITDYQGEFSSFDFDKDIAWGTLKISPGQAIGVCLPTEIIKDREPSLFRRVLATLTPLLKGRFP